jgi:hypothetical protein
MSGQGQMRQLQLPGFSPNKPTAAPASAPAKKPLSAAQIEQRRAAGRSGYRAATERLGTTEFHRRGGAKMRSLELFTAPDGSIGYEAAVRWGAHKPLGKKHRH